MSATTMIRPAEAGSPVSLARLFRGCLESIAHYFGRRDAIAWLHELDDRALRDIGIARCHIEAAVSGTVAVSELGEYKIVASSAALPVAVGPRAGKGRRAPAEEATTWT